MKAPPAESPANRRRQTTGGLGELAALIASEVKLLLGLGLGLVGVGVVSISVSASELGEFAGVAICLSLTLKASVNPNGEAVLDFGYVFTHFGYFHANRQI